MWRAFTPEELLGLGLPKRFYKMNEDFNSRDWTPQSMYDLGVKTVKHIH
jgi:hypothetical protein